jgi:tetratricopeptide (TPR) repeat protein
MRRTSNLLIVASIVTLVSSNLYAITKEEVISLVKFGISDVEIIKAIEKDRTVFNLQIQDVLQLKREGVPDSVIKYMLQTPQLFGKGREAPKAKEAEKKGEVKEKTPEEIQAEEERRREQERKAAEERARAEEAKRQAYARGVMKQGLSFAEKGKWVEAIKHFQGFLEREGYGPGTQEFYSAKFGMAYALANAKLYQSAARTLVEVLLEGPDKPFFKDAFAKLRELRRVIIYSPPDIEQLTSFDYGLYSKGFQDEVNYVLGEYFYEVGNFDRALKHFEAVSEDAPDKAKALYLTGLVQVQFKMFKSAVESFQSAITIAERTKSDPAIIDLSYMALARIAYEAGSYDAAVFYYKKVPKDSPRIRQVFYELAWTYLMKGDYSRTFGVLQALHTPFFQYTFYPDLWIIEARAFSDLCRYEQAKKALEMHDSEVGAYMEPLKRFIAQQQAPEDFYNNFVASVNGGEVKERLPEKLTYPVLGNVEFYNVYRTIKQIEKEIGEFQRHQGELGQFGAQMLVKLEVLRKERIFEAGVKIQQILRDMDDVLAQAQLHQTEIEVDINSAAIEFETREARRLAGAEVEEEKQESAVKPKASVVIGGDTVVWPFEGEYWFDEFPYYRGLVTSRCGSGEVFR